MGNHSLLLILAFAVGLTVAENVPLEDKPNNVFEPYLHHSQHVDNMMKIARIKIVLRQLVLQETIMKDTFGNVSFKTNRKSFHKLVRKINGEKK